MKRLLLLLLIPFSLLAQTWEQLEDFPGSERDDGVCFSIDNKAYCGTGFDNGFQVTRDFYAFDFNTETWSAIASMPAGKQRQYACAFVYNGKGYVSGGIDGSGSYLNDLWCYSPSTNSWSELAALPDLGRSGSSCFVLGEAAYVVGGKTSASNAVNELWAYSFATDSWIPKNELPIEMWRGIAFTDSSTGSGYAGLGANSVDLNSEMYRYNSFTDSWSLAPSLMLTPRTYGLTSVNGDQVYLFAGQDASGYLSSLERIDMATFNVTTLTDFPDDARRGGSAFSNGTDFYTINGVTASARQKETWVARDALGLASAETENLRVYIKGHTFYADGASKIELYDLSGRIVAEESGEGLNVMGLKGVYIYHVFRQERWSTGRIMLGS